MASKSEWIEWCRYRQQKNTTDACDSPCPLALFLSLFHSLFYFFALYFSLLLSLTLSLYLPFCLFILLFLSLFLYSLSFPVLLLVFHTLFLSLFFFDAFQTKEIRNGERPSRTVAHEPANASQLQLRPMSKKRASLKKRNVHSQKKNIQEVERCFCS